MKIEAIPVELRPREKALHYGIDSLGDDELLALIIGSGVKGHSAIDIARDLLSTYLDLPSLVITNFSSLEEQNGLSRAQALKLIGVFELHNRLNSPMNQKQYSIKDAKDIYQRYRYLENYSQEVFALLMLNKKFKIIKERIMYRGTEDNVSVNLKEIYSELILSRCSNYVIVHNHPDGSIEPSPDDIILTETLQNTNKTLGIKLIDHVIIYSGGYYSFSEKK